MHGKIICKICQKVIAQCRCINCNNVIGTQICKECQDKGNHSEFDHLGPR